MKAISLWQPWASLIAIGAKKVETRGWNTKYRGPIAIQASVRKSRNVIALCGVEPFRTALDRAGLTASKLPFGCVVCVCDLIDVHEIIKPEPEPERSFGDYTLGRGRYAWHLANIRAFREPPRCIGRQRFFNVADEVLSAAASAGFEALR